MDDKDMSSDLKKIVGGCIRNDSRAQRKLFELFSSKMYAVCVRYVGDRDTAKDILQDGFLVVFDKIGTYKGEGSFEGWMRRIFINQSLMYIRKNDALKNSDEIDSVPLVSMGMDTYGAVEQMSSKELLGIIADMPVGFRAVFNLYAIEGYSHAEVAEALGISEGSSRSQLSRARLWLQERIKKYY